MMIYILFDIESHISYDVVYLIRNSPLMIEFLSYNEFSSLFINMIVDSQPIERFMIYLNVYSKTLCARSTLNRYYLLYKRYKE